MKNQMFVSLALVLALVVFAGVSAANPGAPNFGAALYGDGEVWGTKGAAALPPPNGNNNQSFDKLFVIVNGASGQLPVAEAAPRNPAYNGGRWFTHTAMWTAEGMAAHDPLPVLMSYADIRFHQDLGHLEVAPGSPAGGPPPYFECPLLPVR
jgi:hypothetical protein